MTAVTNDNFGLAIAYLLPGFTALWGIAQLSDVVQGWLGGASGDLPTVGGFLYVTLASLAAGLTVSAVRWAVLDTWNHVTGIHQPDWDFSALQQHFEAFEGLVRNHYRFYQHYANMLIALMFTYATYQLGSEQGSTSATADFAAIGLAAVLYVGSRDSLRKYYRRTEKLLNRAVSH